jgi:UDP-N-acetylmuramate: L-alanyl-gamma-D-glutamyl-meso-diaminopimelate ligase
MDLLGPDTLLVANRDDARVMERARRAKGRVVTYGFGEGADLRAIDVVPGPQGCAFTLVHRGEVVGAAVSPLPGRYNLWNVLAAFAVGFDFGVPFERLAAALGAYAGVKKRQEERGEVGGVLVVDDYAHHPTAVAETLTALRARYPGRRLWAVYEPKSNTARRNIHQLEYARAFDAADRVVLAQPYAKDDGLGRERMLDVDALVARIADGGPMALYRPGVEEIRDYLAEHTAPGDVVVVMANSGFGGLIEKLLAALNARFSGAAGG